MALITTSRPDNSGEVTLIITGAEKPATQKIIANYITRRNLRVNNVVTDRSSLALRTNVFIHGLTL